MLCIESQNLRANNMEEAKVQTREERRRRQQNIKNDRNKCLAIKIKLMASLFDDFVILFHKLSNNVNLFLISWMNSHWLIASSAWDFRQSKRQN